MLLKEFLKIAFLLFIVSIQSACATDKLNVLDAILTENLTGFDKAIKNIKNPTFFTDEHGMKHNLLAAAAYSKNLEFTQRLIVAGADVRAENQVGETALFDTIIACNIPAAKLLLQNGANPRHKNKMGLTPLHSAALSQCPGIVKLLISYGADKNVKNTQGLTPYELALKMKNKPLVEQLK